jgi:hypothetical protein
MAITELKPYLSNIADKLKSLLGITDKINAQDFVEKIDDVYEQGKKSQYDEFWDCLQYNGNRQNYIGVFSGRGWNDNIFIPKYDIRPISGHYMFATDVKWAGAMESGIKDLPACLERAGVVLDFSNCEGFTATWSGACIEHIGTIDTRNAGGRFTQTFYYAKNLHTIDKIVLKTDGSQNLNDYTFYACDSLTNIVFEGIIGLGIAFERSSNLTYESLMSIINALKDYSGTTSTYTLTLHANAKAKLTDAEKAIITQKGWTLA